MRRGESYFLGNVTAIPIGGPSFAVRFFAKKFPMNGSSLMKPPKGVRWPWKGTTIITALWAVAVVVSSAFLIRYEMTPGPDRVAPLKWPARASEPRDSKLPTLVMFAHPRCPCTRATLGELELLMARCQGRLTVQVFFIRPKGSTTDWKETDLWRKASAIPGVSVRWDDAGIEARRFHAETSGQVALYGEDGALLFRGGITMARGHSGDNPGRSALQALVEHRASAVTKTPVFGCPIFSAESEQGAVACKR